MTDDPVSPLDPNDRPLASVTLARLLAEAGGPVRRVVFAGGVELHADGAGRWALPGAFPGAPDPALEALRALGLAPAERAEDGGHAPQGAPAGRAPHCPSCVDPAALAARHGLRPILLATPGGASGDVLHLATTAGTLAWRPPVDRLADDPALALHARRLRFAVDALEHHLGCAAQRYADATLAARRAALLFGTHELTALAGHTAAYLELDAALAAALRVYRGTAALAWSAFGPPARGGGRAGARSAADAPPRRFDAAVLRARATPPELREALLDSWAAHGAPARAARALLADAAAEVAHAPVRVTSLEPDVWAASIPIPDPALAGPHATRRGPPRARVDALERTWAIGTEALRAATLAVYAVL